MSRNLSSMSTKKRIKIRRQRTPVGSESLIRTTPHLSGRRQTPHVDRSCFRLCVAGSPPRPPRGEHPARALATQDAAERASSSPRYTRNGSNPTTTRPAIARPGEPIDLSRSAKRNHDRILPTGRQTARERFPSHDFRCRPIQT